jgi:hypothetical protein
MLKDVDCHGRALWAKIQQRSVRVKLSKRDGSRKTKIL